MRVYLIATLILLLTLSLWLGLREAAKPDALFTAAPPQYNFGPLPPPPDSQAAESLLDTGLKAPPPNGVSKRQQRTDKAMAIISTVVHESSNPLNTLADSLTFMGRSNRAKEPRIKQCESVKAAAAEISNTPRAQVDGKVYAKVFGIQNKSIMNMTADEFRHVQNMKKGDLVRDMWTEEMNSGAFFMNCVFRAAVAGGEDPVAAMERISRTMTPTFRGVGLHDQASTKRPREFLVHNKEMRESRHASHSTLEVPGQHSLKRVLTTNGDP
eukprot:jgi/Mesvir1/25923/Mv13708-RA.1